MPVVYHGVSTAQVEGETKSRAKRGVITPNAVAFETETSFLMIYTDGTTPRTEVIVLDGKVGVKRTSVNEFKGGRATDFEGVRAVRRDFRALLAGLAKELVQVGATGVVPDQIEQGEEGPAVAIGSNPQTEALTPDNSPAAPRIRLRPIFPEQ